MAQGAELGVGVLELGLDLLLVLLVASQDLVLLMAFVPLGSAANRLHPAEKNRNSEMGWIKKGENKGRKAEIWE